MTSAKNGNYNCIDLFKFIMAIFVIAIHTFPGELLGNNIYAVNLFQITYISNPFFFLASGFFIAVKFTQPFNSDYNQNAVIKRLKQIIKLYFIWTAVYFPFAVYSYIQNKYSFAYSVLVTIRKIIFRGENYNSWMLWYLLSTIYALVFVYFAIKFKLKPRHFVISSVIIFVLMCTLDSIAKAEIPSPKIIQMLLEYTIVDGRIFIGFVYIPLGIYFYQNPDSLKNLYWLIIPGVILLAFSGNIAVMYNISLGMVSLGVFSLSLKIKLKNSKIYRLLRSSSTYMYFTHMYVYTAVYLLLFHKKQSSLIGFVLTVIFTVLISFTYSFIKLKKAEKKQSNRQISG